MRAVDVIEKKRNGHKLSSEEIRFLVQGYMNKDIPDYQMSAWLMAVYFQGMDAEETAALTLEMARTGYELNLQEISGIKVDKHSTGGVGDTTTLILAPLVASAGIPIAKMSGRGLGHTGGTIDKLESIRGFQVERTKQQFIEQVNAIGVAVMSQTANIAPADKQLYALRDVTATVDSIPLIASSIMSKKIASGADAIVLDVKTGPGAFMKTEAEAMELAKMMVDIGRNVGRKTVAVISSMQQPLGYAIGNALEVKEAIDTLRGEGPDDLIELCLELGAHMLAVSGVSEMREGKNKLHQCIQSGQALQKLKEWITFQGGDAAVIDQPELLPKASHVEQVTAIKSGYVQGIKSEQLGKAAMRLGAGRQTKDSEIDLAAGIMLHKKIGDSVEPGEVLAELHWNEKRADTAEITKMVSEAYQVDAVPVNAPPLVLAVVNSEGIISKQ